MDTTAKKIVIVGAGGFGRETVALIRDINEKAHKWDFIGFIDDVACGNTVEGDQILGDVAYLLNMDPKPYVAIAIANSDVRERIAKQLSDAGFMFPTLIHPTVSIGPNVSIGQGCIICRNIIFTTNITIGDFCILNLNCSFGHDTVLGSYISMMSHTSIAGDVNIGKGCYFGLHCTVINLVSITENCTFGAGAVVVKNIEESGTYIGVPAEKKSKHTLTVGGALPQIK